MVLFSETAVTVDANRLVLHICDHKQNLICTDVHMSKYSPIGPTHNLPSAL